MPVEAQYDSEGGARVAILDAGRATLELSNTAQVELIDRVEVGRRVAPAMRLALQVDDCATATEAVLAAGARSIAPPTRTPWDSLNARLDAPAGIQLTLFEELTEPSPVAVHPVTDAFDLEMLRRCVDLAELALEGGNGPFGSVLVLDGEVRFEDYNHEAETGDGTRHPEFAIAQWAAANLTAEERGRAVVYTSAEHCPMGAAGHAWVGLGRIVFATSSAQILAWRTEWEVGAMPVAVHPINHIAPHLTVAGPVPELAQRVRALLRRSAGLAS